MSVKNPKIVVLYGGPSSEREISLVSGRNFAAALAEHFEVMLLQIDDTDLPDELPEHGVVVFPALHGEFGEDGELQKLLENEGFAYAGCDEQASRLCIDKVKTKERLAGKLKFHFAEQLVIDGDEPVAADEVISRLGENVVFKPADEGSSVGLRVARGSNDISAALARLDDGYWLVERFVEGREMTVGLLDGRALGIVEIRPKGGVYDFEHKYTAGETEYIAPAEIPEEVASFVKREAEKAFAMCGCRDFARLDFILTEDSKPFFLEINTIPGLTPTSLLPKSAQCDGYSFISLAKAMVEPAIERYLAKQTI